MNERILLVEDELALRMTLTDRLRSEGYEVESAPDGDCGLKKATGEPFDLVVLDLMLPCRGGLDVCRQIRAAGMAVPVLMLTARSQTVDKVIGLKIGGDDYLTKPFDTLELMARIEALIRRSRINPNDINPNIHTIGEVRIDLRSTAVTRRGEPVQLSRREFQLLRYFVEHRGKTLSRAEILREVWGYSAGTLTRTIDVHIASLRQKLGPDAKQPSLILTVLGLGYKLRPD
jgi:two-component system, OmpR family, alkaline phosphatase synthesis response regulator PhoP